MYDTIYALATPLGGALAVVRISGAKAKAILQACFSAPCESAPRSMLYGKIKDQSGETLDVCMAAFFPAPKSYTGEDMAELYLHGGAAVVRRVLCALGDTGLCRSAEPGEFTKRAFLNGKMELTRAEAVMDLINAQTALSAKAAAEQLAGSLQGRIASLEEALRYALSSLDAAIDYPEELEEDVESALPETLENARLEIEALIENGEKARLLREGARVVIAGKPNAGKSSLLNALLGQERAIVTGAAGTTRDILQESADFCGVPVRLYDTAGLRDGADEAEKIGVERAREAVENADLLLIALDASEPLCETDKALLEETKDRVRIVLLLKSDLPAVLHSEGLPSGTMSLSALTGEGIEELKEAAAMKLGRTESAMVTNARHIGALKQAKQALMQAQGAQDMDCAATDLRDALLALGAITGSAVDEAVIEGIFASFCVGK